ncbi:hybrid sensor histidine kinase/response regulator transcription factor [Bacteroides sp. 224]|uniref:hybrid sensor histidine kinase/response regulator transcription factor n=1 Tax=Bacteroides sp. 224 TaxID=2302936 RepID=UPI0013D28DC9|nr:hybrid sensor histidine kinase/response regulator transcription factor [Bacteroides sp. 224]NDV64035.1 hybrid sensor histidine kinase/response regulator [Bacteroides sp. 224]
MKKHLLLLFFLSISFGIYANPNIIVEHYGVEQGLPNNNVNCSLKGEDGFIWFGTWYGLCSFDGTKFKTYNNREGFYSDIPPRKIQSIVEDKNGFLWIKTIDRKLYIFNKHYERFHAVYDDVKDYSGNTQIIKIQNTPDGEVLLLTKDKNLLRAYAAPDGKIEIKLLHDASGDINPYDSRLKYNVFVETQEYISWIGQDYQIFSCRKGDELQGKPADFICRKMSVSSHDIFTCAYETSDFVWLGDKAGGVYSINIQSGSVNKYELPGVTNAIQNILILPSGVAYISVRNQGVYEYNLGYKQQSKLPVSLDTTHALHSFVDKYDKIWFVENDNALLYYDPLNKTSKRFPFNVGLSIVSFEYQDAGEQGLFFLTPAGEMLMFDRENANMISLNTLKPFTDVMPEQLFFDQMVDEDGVLWLASTAMGVYRVNFPKKQFKLFEPQKLSGHSNLDVSNKGVRALFQAKNGDVWIGTRWADLYRLNANGQLKQVFSEGNSFIGNVYHIMEDDKGNLWFSTKGNGLVKAQPDILSPAGFRFTRFTNDANVLSSINHNDAYFTYQDSKGRIWAGLMGGGLNLVWEEGGEITFKNKYNGFKHYPPYGLYLEVRNITEDADGRIWVGTTDGLMSFDGNFNAPEEIVFETYREESASSNIADNDIYVLYKDADSQIWVSVFGGGLNKLIKYDHELRRPIFKTYGMREGLNTDVIVSIVEDDKQNLWLATESGLSRFNKQTEHFRNYDKYDGFLNVKMEEGSALRTLNNDLWLGCREGVLIFNPDKLESFNSNFQTYIVDFKISNKELWNFKDHPIITESIKYAEEITLKYDQSMFALEFAALNYVNPNRISYTYILEGYEREWHFSGKSRIASYTNVPPGKYLFRVQSVDEATPDTVSEKTLHITILPPWWRSWWAYTIYVILGAIFLFFGIRVALLLMKMKNDIYIEQKLSELKIKFFTNISHELRTPLTLIKGPIQELKEKERLSSKGKQYVELMEKNTDQMLQLVNQILDFRKIQNGKMRLHVSQMNLNVMMNSFHKEFRILAEENEINYSFHLTDEPIMIWADKERLGIVVRNVISNAFKFTSAGGSIFVSTGITNDGKNCYIRVEDSGVGIEQSKLDEIFERFSQGENSRGTYYQGTGIGLALSKEIMHLHHGSIKVESQQQKGSVFTIELNIGKEYYKPSEVDFYMSDNDKATDEELQNMDIASEDNIDTDEPANAALPTLLLVEDNRDLASLIKLQLEDKFNVYTANNGVEGLKKVHLYHPDIVVTDQMMPEMDGLEMLRLIRKDFQISHIPVIILTAKNDDEAKTNAISQGANAYITKPFSKEYLIARVDQLLRERKLFRERVWQQQENPETDNYEQYLVKKDVQLLEKIHKVIEENMDNCDFNIDAIASNIGLSRSAFFKKLKSLTGLAPVDLVKEVRLNKSVELLKNTDMSISEVAYAVGFKDSGYYSKCFRKKYNQTPREYINEWRKG